jgi:hypothetical protein
LDKDLSFLFIPSCQTIINELGHCKPIEQSGGVVGWDVEWCGVWSKSMAEPLPIRPEQHHQVSTRRASKWYTFENSIQWHCSRVGAQGRVQGRGCLADRQRKRRERQFCNRRPFATVECRSRQSFRYQCFSSAVGKKQVALQVTATYFPIGSSYKGTYVNLPLISKPSGLAGLCQ